MTTILQRREFIALLGGGTIAWPLTAGAQQPVDDGRGSRVKRIGVLMSLPGSDIEAPLRVAAFLQHFQELGWRDRRNVRIDYRLAESETTQSVTAEVVEHSPDVLLVNGASMLKAARDATRTIPIVFVNVIDPVGQGFVTSLDHPGGNITGLSNVESDMGGKWVQLLKEVAPQVAEVAVIGASVSGGAGIVGAIQAATPSGRVKLVAAGALVGTSELERVFAQLARQPNTGLIVLPGPLTLASRKRIIALAARSRLPAIYPYRYYATDGGLMSYGVDTAEAFRHAATYVDRILKGEKPADLPVERATKFELVVNMQTARMLGIEVPPSLLEGADEVIE
jgi:putative tryptophan/tyrosine transport system substrate-binding protein